MRCLCLSTNRAESGCEAVGHLGEMSKAQALASLLSCPLLEDLSEWSQWELIFKPQHDSLKEFIERNAGINGTSPTVGLASISSRIFLSFFFRLLFFYAHDDDDDVDDNDDDDLLPHAANTGLAALEVTPGSLLRIASHTGDKHFAAAAASLDHVGTAGHLVSMVVADGPVNAPIALLANHMQSSLAAAVVKEGTSTTVYHLSPHPSSPILWEVTKCFLCLTSSS